MDTDVLTLLEQDHRHVERLLDQLAESEEGAEREELVRRLDRALSVHMRFEESELYPEVARLIGSEEAEEAEIEHGLAREGLSKLTELVSQPGFGAAVEMLKGGIGHHVEDEEGEVFPGLRKQLDDEALRRLGARLRSAQESAGLTTDLLEFASKEALLDAAKEAGVKGRSSMTKAELKEALLSR